MALFLVSASWSLATPIKDGDLANPDAKGHPALDAVGDVATCVEQWSKDHNAASLSECIEAVMHNQANAF
ncbi:MAG: hypothetical protein LQ337_003892 [Flavoplaca oasis]|nr:MAG: hypothetical protein LQ337_003892 [Flavoplaca oasis]